MYTLLDRNSGVRGIRTGSGEPVILLHGVGMAAEIWTPQIEHLADTHLVIAPNLPGHGSANLIADTWAVEDFVSWLESFIHSLGAGPANLVGHSLGALIALHFTATHPARVSRLALLNCVYQRSAAAVERAAATVDAIRSGTFDYAATLQRWFPGNDESDASYRLCKQLLLGVDPVGYAKAYSVFAQGDHMTEQDLAGIHCPTLLITGADDPHSTAAMSIALCQRIPRASTAIIQDHRHMVALTAPRQINGALSHWLESTAA